MRVLYSPCRADKEISYQFDNEIITVEFNGQSEVFDLSGEVSSESSLEIQPIINAERIDGELYVILLNFIGPDATLEERFPDWMEV